MSRPYQVVIFGASGFTGEYVVEQLAKYLNKSRTSLSWAAAGRSEAKVKRTLLSVGTRIGMKLDTIPIITATVGDDSSLDSMTKQTVLLLNITGPYSCYGEAVVASCVRNSCHYIDIVDIYEPLFMESIQLKYQEAAAEKGIYIIPSCGFDSIPWDMGVNFIKDAFKPGKLNSIESFLSSTNTTGYHTTWDCAVDVHADKDSLISTRKLLYEQQYEEVSKMQPKVPLKHREPGRFSDQATELNGWIVPFGNGDQFVVRKSQMANNILYGEKDMAQMKAYIVDNLFNFLRFLLTGFWIKLLSPFSYGRTLLKMFPGFFSSGFFTSRGATREVHHPILRARTNVISSGNSGALVQARTASITRLINSSASSL